ncbi:helix-turn-helix domain-containing protein [Metallosphaera hakonensis]|uniref:Bacterio-opsin activator n=1 Tax=Metallosphaera hakonensis JCM 8857 = DSM 7519 TaxID=1293036 RepID=A0A2U9IUA4_9CREN|nr:helix-turn-helix domain-containing protein [Metallosphaera hakonensis]AWR99562.1 bacterio-opsin activator [Metallosphaera hakonensis JCM 8857 = DSM 7519]
MILRVTLVTPTVPFNELNSANGTLTILDIKQEGESQRLLVEFKGDEEVLQKFQGNFTKVSKLKYLGTIKVRGVIEEVLSRYIIVNGVINEKSTLWTVILNGYQELKRLLKDLHEHGVDAKVLKVTKYKTEDILTARQEQILRIALEAGYYEFPRKITIRGLAEKLELSVSSLSEIIRRAEKNVIINYFDEKGL